MSKKIDKHELKAPDAFVSTSDKVFKWLEQNAKPILAGLAIVFIGAMGWVTYGWMDAQTERKAADALYAPEAELKKAETKVREERAKGMGDLAAGKKDTKPESVRPADYTKDYAPIVEKLKAKIKEHNGTKAALVSALNLSYFLMQQKQFAEALAVLELPAYKPGTSDVLGAFWQMHRGVVLLENQKTDEAIQAYQAILNAPALKAFHPEAMLKTGIALEVKGDQQKARETYEKLGREFPNTEASTSAQQYLRLLELNTPKQG